MQSTKNIKNLNIFAVPSTKPNHNVNQDIVLKRGSTSFLQKKSFIHLSNVLYSVSNFKREPVNTLIHRVVQEQSKLESERMFKELKWRNYQ